MRTRIIGIGAAGNKAAISAVEDGIDKIENILLVNSTLKDIPSDFKGQTYCFQKAYGGCGKERNKAKQLMLKDLESDAMKLEQFLGIDTDNQAELVVLVSSTEGGTGSSAGAPKGAKCAGSASVRNRRQPVRLRRTDRRGN